MKIYTKTGDDGDTGLVGGTRVSKDHLRVNAYGDVDELNAYLGLARSDGECWGELDEHLACVQSELFELGAELATPAEQRSRSSGVTGEDIKRLEQDIDAMDGQLPQLRAFVLPGGTPLAGVLHLARGVCRRAERRCVKLNREGLLARTEPLIYLNRLSDWLFVAARMACHRAGVVESLWRPRTT